MGKGGNKSGGKGAKASSGAPLRKIATIKTKDLPTKREIRDAVPKHCFEHNNLYSLWLVVRDGIIISALAYGAWHLPTENLTALDWALWSAYWFLEGAALTGWWVLAHECGHRGFSNSKLLCDVVGWILHSFLLVPYFSWQYSHAKHHKNTNHLLDGETHVPGGRSYANSFGKIYDIVGEDAFALWELVAHLVFGWPMYLFFNATGARRTLSGDRITTVHDHFRPSSKLFPEHGGWNARVLMSTIGCAGTIAGLCYAGSIFGATKVFMLYFPSYLWVNFWLVLYTWLQHTAADIPHFGDGGGDLEWNWVRGALCTIDRPYGVFDWMHHYIGSTHVCHHLFSDLPCYHAVEATKALKAYLEPKGLYHYDGTNFMVAAWNVAKTCHYVEGVQGMQFYKSLADRNTKKNE